MPRKPTGKPPGRPRTARAENGGPDPVVYQPSDEAKRALRTEIAFYRIQSEGSADVAAWPVLSSPSMVAREASVTARAVQKWRKAHWYKTHFWSAILSDKLATRSQHEKAKKALEIHRQDLVAWIRERWPEAGFVDSQINGRRYHSPEQYAQHLRQENAVPHEWVKEKDAIPGS